MYFGKVAVNVSAVEFRHHRLVDTLTRALQEFHVTPDELGATGTFLASDGAAAITGQVLYVDGGYQIMGM